MTFRFGKEPPAKHFDIASVEASRAIVAQQAGYLPTVQIRFMTTDQEKIEFELKFEDTAKLIEELMAAYNAIVPPLKTSRGGFGL